VFDVARRIADAVLYEGYVLYPYRASAKKNQIRWQFGVVFPPEYAKRALENSFLQTECLLEPHDDCRIHAQVRFLQVQARTVERATDLDGDDFEGVDSLEVEGETYVAWDEAVDREAEVVASLTEILEGEYIVPIEVSGNREVELITDAQGIVRGRVVRETWPAAGRLRLDARRLEGPYDVVVLQAKVENTTPWTDDGGGRDVALRHALVAAHTLIAATDGVFISLLEPPEWARHAVESLVNLHTFPVLVGDRGHRDLILSSPIILYDYPEIAPESPGELFDGTEIDEILSLRTMALTDDEKREARATDERAAAIIDRVDSMPQEVLDRLHGAVRYVREATESKSVEDPSLAVPWWDPGADTSVSPETDWVQIGRAKVMRGSRVLLRPGIKRADAQDIFLVDRVGVVQAVLFDVDDNKYLAVTLEDDPAADLHQWHGRFLYFSPDEVEPLKSQA
jgi:hypothetical protein